MSENSGAVLRLIDSAEAAASFAEGVFKDPPRDNPGTVQAAVHALEAATRAIELVKTMGGFDNAEQIRIWERLYGTAGEK